MKKIATNFLNLCQDMMKETEEKYEEYVHCNLQRKHESLTVNSPLQILYDYSIQKYGTCSSIFVKLFEKKAIWNPPSSRWNDDVKIMHPEI